MSARTKTLLFGLGPIGVSIGRAAAERDERRAKSVASAEELLPVGKAVWLEDSIHDVPVQRPELVAGVIKAHIHEGFFAQAAG